MIIPVFKPVIRRKEMDAVLTCLVSEQIGTGAITKELVALAAGYLDLPGGLAFRDVTRALAAALEILELKEGDKVILSALSPGYYLDVIREKKLDPVFVDVDPASGCIHVEDVDARLDQDPKLLLIHSPLGFIPDLERLRGLGIPLIEDISHSIGGNTGNEKCGRFGNFTLISLEPDSMITTAGGGILLAHSQKEWNLLKQKAAGLPGESLLTNMNAALGIVQMKSLEEFLQKRQEIARIYSQSLMRSSHGSLAQNSDAENIYYTFPVLLNSGTKEVQQYARKKGIETVLAFAGSLIHRLEPSEQSYPVSRSLALRCLLFPLYPFMSKKNVSQVVKVLSTLP